MAQKEEFKQIEISNKIDKLMIIVEKSIEENNNEIKLINKRIDNLENDMKLIKNYNKNINEEMQDIKSNKITQNINHNSLDKDFKNKGKINVNNEINESEINFKEKDNALALNNNKKEKSNNIRGKYKKNEDKSEFLKGIQYLEILDGTKIWKYSISRYNEHSDTGYYYCSDTSCNGRGTYYFKKENKNLFGNKKDNDKFNITKEHNIDFEHHNYNINQMAIKDIMNYEINQIKLKLTDIKYLQIFIKKYAIKHNEECTSAAKLFNIFTEEFGHIELDYNSLTEEEQNKYIERFKNKKKFSDNAKIKIEDVVNIKNFCVSGYIHLRNLREFDLAMHKNLTNFKINEKNVVNELEVTFKRKNKIFTNSIYVIMSETMEENIKRNNNIQYFLDVTYYATPPTNKKYKLLVILAFNRDLFKSVLCNLSIIEKENKETFYTILKYLSNKYNWKPLRISIDYSKSERNAIIQLFPDIEILPCFFHFMENIVKHLKDIRSRNKTIKKLAKDCLSNIKLLSFIPLNKFDSLYELILKKYRSKFPNFFKYFERNYINL